MEPRSNEFEVIADDVRTLHSLGYAQELLRRMSGFSNFAISFAIICIVAGGITSFHLGLCSVGGAAIGLGWPLVSLFSLAVAATMGQVASAFPTAGGLYHWASILGGRGWGWATAWFNLLGLVLVLAGINVGTYRFVAGAAGYPAIFDELIWQLTAVTLITFSQALCNHLGIRVTTILIDFSGYWILLVAVALTVAMLAFPSGYPVERLVTFTNYSGKAGHDVWPETSSLLWLFALGFLLPAYTITGFDASAHTSEETIGAAREVPRGIVRSMLISGIFGWIMLSAIVLAIPNMDVAAKEGDNVFYWIMENVLPGSLRWVLYVGIAVAQYLCGLAAVTSASRMTFAFARDGGLPLSGRLRHIHPIFRTPVAAIWTVSIAAVLFTIYAPVYSTLTTACTLFLYVSYILPTALGFIAYGRTWTKMGPWTLGRLYLPLALVSVLGGGLLIAVGMAPPNELAAYTLAGTIVLLLVVWFGVEQRRFQGPPQGTLIALRQAEIAQTEKVLAHEL